MRIWYRCDGGESRKNILDGARLNPKHYDNRQSAANPEKESSTTIPREGEYNTSDRYWKWFRLRCQNTLWIRYSLCLLEITRSSRLISLIY